MVLGDFNEVLKKKKKKIKRKMGWGKIQNKQSKIMFKLYQ